MPINILDTCELSTLVLTPRAENPTVQITFSSSFKSCFVLVKGGINAQLTLPTSRVHCCQNFD